MAWVEQTKKGSRESGGPQYYLQDLSANVSTVLGARKRCPLRLWTPYGIVETGLLAVSKKIGAVGHDRVQLGGGGRGQVAEQVAHWYRLKSADIETIEFGDTLDDDTVVIAPRRVTFFGRKGPKRIEQDSHPLTLTLHHRSSVFECEIKRYLALCRVCRPWLIQQISSLVEQHGKALPSVDERDLLRASGALHRLGVDLGMYRSRGIDCPEATFRFNGYPPYPCPVEIEERSSGFLGSHHAKHRKQRTVVLCMEHDEPEVLRDYIDVIELRAVRDLLGRPA